MPGRLQAYSHRNARLWSAALALAAILYAGAPLAAQVSQDQAAAMILSSARKAYNERNYPFAVARFREFLQRFGGHKDAGSARYGLALALIDSPERNFTEARDLLQGLAGNKGMPEHASILYHLGVALRGLGVGELAQAAAKPQEAGPRQAAARQRFEEAARQLQAAAAAFGLKGGAVPPDAKELPLDLEWAARARCDQAEMELRTDRVKEARQTAELFVSDPVWARSRYRDLGRYYYGFASYLLKDYPAAEKALSLLAPFADPAFGTHARYLLARTHHRADERAEAALHYAGVVDDYARMKKEAGETLRKPEAARLKPAERARLEALANGPAPEHVGRASFYQGVLHYEAGRFGDAQAQFALLPKLFPGSPLLAAAQLRLGFCQVQLREFPQAIQTLQPLVDRQPGHADQALLWIGKAQIGTAPDPGNFPAYEKAIRAALDTFRRAADKANQLGNDPLARARRGDILLEIGDALLLIKQPREGAQTYNQILNDKLLPQREEEVAYRLITALHLAGDHNESDNLCSRFAAVHPRSVLLPAVLFRQAENSYFRTLAAEKGGNKAELGKLYDETIKRYQTVVQRFPEYPQVNLARHGAAICYYRKGELDRARQALEAVPPADRVGELAVVSYLLADCIMRLTPTSVPEDALAAGKMEEQLKSATELLEAFTSAQPNDTQAADALLKLGLCYQRLAGLLAEPPERAKVLQSARATYDKLLAPQHARYPGQPQAVLERAKCMALAGDANGAVNELRRFTNDPLRTSPIAAMAQVQLATLLRGQNKAGEAADLLAKARGQYEPDLMKDAARAGWVALLRYHHGLALREAGKLAEARGAFEQVMKQAPNSPESVEAALRFGQCLKEEGVQKLVAAAKARAGAGKPDQMAAAEKLRDDAMRTLREAVKFLEERAQQLKGKDPPPEARARMLYETAWAYRDLAEPEVEAVRTRMAQKLAQEMKLDLSKFPSPEVPLAKVPVQPAEEKARAAYKTLIGEFPDLPLATEARFELAELLAGRGDNDQALKLLSEGLDKEPAAELADKIRLRLGAAHAARGDLKAALAQFDAVAQNPKSPLATQAQYRAGECLMQSKQWAEAVKRLSLYRDNPQYQNVPGVSDRALLRLGHAYEHLGDWNQMRIAHEALTQRFGNSPWVHEARYGIGWAWQQQKQYDQAVNAYNQVTASTLTETAARAQLQIGVCRLEQKHFAEASTALLVVPFTYDYPELSAVALLEAARAHAEMKQPRQARRLLERVIRDHPQTRQAEAARERLAGLKDS
jgi:tetratricopeptide (TPR) repeat protein